jgi:hypothetical protein
LETPQALERLHRAGERMATGPVQQVQLDALAPQPLQAALAGGDRPGGRRVRRQHLRDHERTIAQSGDRLADDRLGAAVGVHLGGVDQRRAELDRATDRGDLGAPRRRAFAHLPRADAECGRPAAPGQRDRRDRRIRSHRRPPSHRAARGSTRAYRRGGRLC